MYLHPLPRHASLCLLFSINFFLYSVCAPSRIMNACHRLAAFKNPHRLETSLKTQNIVYIHILDLLLMTHSGQQSYFEGELFSTCSSSSRSHVF